VVGDDDDERSRPAAWLIAGPSCRLGGPSASAYRRRENEHERRHEGEGQRTKAERKAEQSCSEQRK